MNYEKIDLAACCEEILDDLSEMVTDFLQEARRRLQGHRSRVNRRGSRAKKAT